MEIEEVVHPIKPRGAWITTNRDCNFRCDWCYAQGTGYYKKDEIDIADAKRIAELISSIGIKKIILIGGEPTLWSGLFEMNQVCRDIGVRTTIVTNAMRFGDDNFWSQYVESPNDGAGVSVKGYSSSSLESLAGVKKFNIVEKGIRRAIEFFGCGVSITYNNHYRGKLLEFAKFSMDCGAGILKIDLCTPVFKDGLPDSSNMVVLDQIVSEFTTEYLKLNEMTGGKLLFDINIPLCLFPDEFISNLIVRNQILTVCHVHQRCGLIFDVNGKLLICNGLFDFPIGEMKIDFVDGDSLLNFLNSSEITSIYDKISSYPSNKCASCRLHDVCAGGCPLRWTFKKPEEVIPGLK